MADDLTVETGFRDTIARPQFKVEVFKTDHDDKKLFFFSPEVKSPDPVAPGTPKPSDPRSFLFQANHSTPNNQYVDREGKVSEFYQRIGSEAAGQYRYDHRDFSTNGQLIPQKGGDALRLGVAGHNGSHPAYDEFVKKRDLDIQDRGAEVEEFEKNRLLNDPDNPISEADAEARAIDKATHLTLSWGGSDVFS